MASLGSADKEHPVAELKPAHRAQPILGDHYPFVHLHAAELRHSILFANNEWNRIPAFILWPMRKVRRHFHSIEFDQTTSLAIEMNPAINGGSAMLAVLIQHRHISLAQRLAIVASIPMRRAARFTFAARSLTFNNEAE